MELPGRSEKGSSFSSPFARVFHITIREALFSVYLPQVVRPFSLLSQKGHNIDLIAFCSLGEFFRSTVRVEWRQRLQTIGGEFGLRIQRYPLPPSRLKNVWSGVKLLRHRVQAELKSNISNVVLHCRGPYATELAIRATTGMSRVNVVFDCRGVTGIEYAYDHGYLEIEEAPYTIRSMAQRIENIERYVAHKASRMTCVSQAMRSFVSERWNVPRQKIDVVPCCTDVASGIKAAQDREKLREQLGLRDSFVVLFSGSLASYQTPNESLKFFGHVLAIRPDAHFFGLTTHPERLVRAIQDSSIPISKTTVKSVLHDDVFRYLSIGDCGLLIRESCKVNKVASPVKFAEYLAAGVPVVLSQGIGDYSRFVEQNSLGAVLPGQPSSLTTQDVEAALKRIQHSSRRGIQRVAGMHLDWSTCIELIERSWSTKD